MKYVRINGKDYVLIREQYTTAGRIIDAWIRQKEKRDLDVSMMMILRHNANGTRSVLSHDDDPGGYCDFDIVEVNDNA